MTRIRFDPSFVEDERWERLGLEALALHLTAVSYTTRTLSDGVLSPARVRVLTPLVADPDAVAALLVADGLWDQLKGGHLQVCQVRDDLRHADGRGDEQPSRAFVERERERSRTAKEKWRKSRNGGGNAVPSEGPNGAQASADQLSAVQDTKCPSPDPHDDDAPGAASPPVACADPRCDGTGWSEQNGRAEKCADFDWHKPGSDGRIREGRQRHVRAAS